jgi:hypothetical protein
MRVPSQELAAGCTTWHYENAWINKWDQDSLRQYMAKIKPDSKWLQREVVLNRPPTD